MSLEFVIISKIFIYKKPTNTLVLLISSKKCWVKSNQGELTSTCLQRIRFMPCCEIIKNYTTVKVIRVNKDKYFMKFLESCQEKIL